MRPATCVSLAGLATLLLAGCYPPTSEDSFGQAVRHNMAAHIINPAPAPADLGPPPLNSTRAALAAQRYLEDDVEEPVDVTTTDTVFGED